MAGCHKAGCHGGCIKGTGGLRGWLAQWSGGHRRWCHRLGFLGWVSQGLGVIRARGSRGWGSQVLGATVAGGSQGLGVTVAACHRNWGSQELGVTGLWVIRARNHRGWGSQGLGCHRGWVATTRGPSQGTQDGLDFQWKRGHEGANLGAEEVRFGLLS